MPQITDRVPNRIINQKQKNIATIIINCLIRSFMNLRESVISYMENINSHVAYKSFREKRFEYRKKGIKLDSFILVHKLSPYAELPNYTEILHQIIKLNKLYIFDDMILIDAISLV